MGWFAGIAYCSNSTLEAMRTRAPIIASAKYPNVLTQSLTVGRLTRATHF